MVSKSGAGVFDEARQARLMLTTYVAMMMRSRLGKQRAWFCDRSERCCIKPSISSVLTELVSHFGTLERSTAPWIMTRSSSMLIDCSSRRFRIFAKVWTKTASERSGPRIPLPAFGVLEDMEVSLEDGMTFDICLAGFSGSKGSFNRDTDYTGATL